jgi:hypothetical protein
MAVEMDSRHLELIMLSLLAAFGFGIALALDRNIIAAVFAAESLSALAVAILRLK